MQKNRQMIDCKILSNKKILNTEKYFMLELEWKNANKIFLPGQFVEIEISKSLDTILRKPFTVFDATKNSIKIIYKVLGKGTRLLSYQKKADFLNIIGPLGNFYNTKILDAKNDKKENNFQNIFIIGAGTGAANIHFLIKNIINFEQNNNDNYYYYLILGFKSKNDIFCLKEIFELKRRIADLKKVENFQIFITTDDGSFDNGKKGYVTDFFGKFENKLKSEKSLIFMCGPKIVIKKWYEKMLKLNVNNSIENLGDFKNPKIKNKSKDFKKENKVLGLERSAKKFDFRVTESFKMFASFEEYMACGLGVCNGCVIKVKDQKNKEKFKYKKVCECGTIFDLEEILWD
ncbi:MAG: hypothetical protein LBF97_07070 [Elusimicrobiota bacterium]|nr:hypothetical protein [Elusimicrobiota bacterium]